MLTAKVECMTRDTSGMDEDCNSHNCGECHLCYEQGNMGEQVEYLQMAIKALEEPQWIPVTKKAHPDLPIRVQVQMNNGWIITAYYQEGEWLSVPDCGEPLLDNWIEAWRDLPEPWRGDAE